MQWWGEYTEDSQDAYYLKYLMGRGSKGFYIIILITAQDGKLCPRRKWALNMTMNHGLATAGRSDKHDY